MYSRLGLVQHVQVYVSNVNISCKYFYQGLPCLHLTAKSGHLDCMRYLLDNFEVDVNHVTELNGNSALHYCITAQFNSKRYLCLKLLVERGANHFMYVNKRTIPVSMINHFYVVFL